MQTIILQTITRQTIVYICRGPRKPQKESPMTNGGSHAPSPATKNTPQKETKDKPKDDKSADAKKKG